MVNRWEVEGKLFGAGFGVARHSEIVRDGVDPGAGIGDGLAVAESGVVAEEGFAGEVLGFGGRDVQGDNLGVDFVAAFEEEGGDLGVEGVGHALLP